MILPFNSAILAFSCIVVAPFSMVDTFQDLQRLLGPLESSRVVEPSGTVPATGRAAQWPMSLSGAAQWLEESTLSSQERSHRSKVTLTPSSPGGAGVLDTAPGAALTPELWGKGSLSVK